MRRTISRAPRRALYEMGTLVGTSPWIALTVARRTGHGEVLGPGTEIVIEGFPRSGNSFAVAAFRHAQSRPVRVAHHTHAPAQVLAAARASIPTLVLIREPEEACLELLRLKPFLSAGQVLRGYVRFYAPLLPVRERVVVGPFPEVTTDFGAVTERVNARFGTAFVPFEHTEENVRESMRAADGYWSGRTGPGLPLIGRSADAGATPSGDGGDRADPGDRSDAPGRGLLDPALHRIRGRADSLYRTLSGLEPAGPR